MPVRVLLLDDDLAFASEARAAFVAAGCEVEVHGDGGTAAGRVAERQPDVVLASAELPGVNGFRLCSRMKKDHPELAVVLTFSDASASGVASHQRLASRADAYIPRSVALHELVARVRTLAGQRPRSDTPTSTRRRVPSGSSRPRSKTPGSSRVLGGPPRPAALPLPPSGLGPPSSRLAALAPPRPDPSRSSDRDALRRVAESAKAERDELKRELGAARTDADALRRATETARREASGKAAELTAVQRDLVVTQRELVAVQRDLVALTAEIEAVRGERDDRARELVESRARIARLEEQVVLAEREGHGPSSERVDQRLLVLQRTADAARLDREAAHQELALEQARRAELERSLAEEIAAREAAEALRIEDEAQSLLATEADPTTVEARIAEAVERAKREHALEMTRLRGEHAAVVFQHRHELATLRAKARGPKVTPSAGMARATIDSLGDADAFAEPVRPLPDSIAALEARHEREMDAMRANLDVAIRRVETLERQLDGGGGSGERPSVVTARTPDRTRGAR